MALRTMDGGSRTVVPAHGDIRLATGTSSTGTVDVRGLERHLRRPPAATGGVLAGYRARRGGALGTR